MKNLSYENQLMIFNLQKYRRIFILYFFLTLFEWCK